jgi:hypothetical protein
LSTRLGLTKWASAVRWSSRCLISPRT